MGTIFEGDQYVAIYQARYLESRTPERWHTIGMSGFRHRLPENFDSITDVREEGLRKKAEVRCVLIDLYAMLLDEATLKALTEREKPYVKVEIEYSPEQEAALLESRAQAEKAKMLKDFYGEVWGEIKRYAHADAGALWEAIQGLPVVYNVGGFGYGVCGWVQFTPETWNMLERFKAGAREQAQRQDADYRSKQLQQRSSDRRIPYDVEGNDWSGTAPHFLGKKTEYPYG